MSILAARKLIRAISPVSDVDNSGGGEHNMGVGSGTVEGGGGGERGKESSD
jgi:hypothetical protein